MNLGTLFNLIFSVIYFGGAAAIVYYSKKASDIVDEYHRSRKSSGSEKQ